MKGEGKKARDERQIKISVELYKKCFALESALRIFGDSGYVRRLYSINQDPSSIAGIHSEMIELFGVEQFQFRTTWCVLNDIQSNLEKAVKRVADLDWEEDYYEWAKCRDEVDYWRGLKKYASNLEVCCEHSNRPVTSGLCIKRSLQNELLEPFLLGSTEIGRCYKIKKEFGIPSFYAKKDRITLYPSERVRGSHKKLMQDFTFKRDLAREEASLRELELEEYVQRIEKASLRELELEEYVQQYLLWFIFNVFIYIYIHVEPNGGAAETSRKRKRRKKKHEVEPNGELEKQVGSAKKKHEVEPTGGAAETSRKRKPRKKKHEV